MITKDKIDLFLKLKGNLDLLARSRFINVISESEWFIILDCIQNYQLILKGLTSEDFENKFYHNLNLNFKDEETVKYFLLNASKYEWS